MLPYIEKLYDTFQHSKDQLDKEIEDISLSLQLFQESLSEYSDTISDLYNNFLSLCEDAEEEDISVTEIITVLSLMEKKQVFAYLLSKAGKSENYRVDSGKRNNRYFFMPFDLEQNLAEDEELPFK